MVDKYCPECGAEHEGTAFCPECGTRIQEGVVTGAEADESSESREVNVDEDSDEDGGLNITLGKIVGYIVGPILILTALGALIAGSVGAGFLYLIAGGISLPIVRKRLKAKRGISLSRWATVAVVIVLILAGGAMLGTGGGNGSSPVDSGDGDQGQSLIEKPATDIVLQLDQMGSGWTQAGSEGNETHAVSEFFRSEDSTYLSTTVDRYETTEDASDEYESRVNDIQERHGTDSVNVGNEAILYSISDSVWVVFRDSNIVVEVQYQKEFAFDPEGQATNFAKMVEENANS